MRRLYYILISIIFFCAAFWAYYLTLKSSSIAIFPYEYRPGGTFAYNSLPQLQNFRFTYMDLINEGSPINAYTQFVLTSIFGNSFYLRFVCSAVFVALAVSIFSSLAIGLFGISYGLLTFALLATNRWIIVSATTGTNLAPALLLAVLGILVVQKVYQHHRQERTCSAAIPFILHLWLSLCVGCVLLGGFLTYAIVKATALLVLVTSIILIVSSRRQLGLFKRLVLLAAIVLPILAYSSYVYNFDFALAYQDLRHNSYNLPHTRLETTPVDRFQSIENTYSPDIPIIFGFISHYQTADRGEELVYWVRSPAELAQAMLRYIQIIAHEAPGRFPGPEFLFYLSVLGIVSFLFVQSNLSTVGKLFVALILPGALIAPYLIVPSAVEFRRGYLVLPMLAFFAAYVPAKLISRICCQNKFAELVTSAGAMALICAYMWPSENAYLKAKKFDIGMQVPCCEIPITDLINNEQVSLLELTSQSPLFILNEYQRHCTEKIRPTDEFSDILKNVSYSVDRITDAKSIEANLPLLNTSKFLIAECGFFTSTRERNPLCTAKDQLRLKSGKQLSWGFELNNYASQSGSILRVFKVIH
ncbi:MAG: hypothetical protein K1X79_01545 [Oligoflexia bacterium]|nr:hypothetical protein [Oligoflexia bacterium]